MTFYTIYHYGFPIGFGAVAILCLVFATAGLFLRRPLVYSSKVPLFGIFAFLLPMFLIALRHIIAPPFFSGHGIYLNSFLVVLYPFLAYYSLVYCRGYTVLGVSPAKLREALQNHTHLRVLAFRGMAMALVVKKRNAERELNQQELRELVDGIPREIVGYHAMRFLPTFFLGAFLGWGAFWSWCEATQCSDSVQAFSFFMMELKRTLL